MTARLGLGTYLQSGDELLQVLERAEHFGLDLLDTATNYGHGVSQTIIGQYLRGSRAWRPKVVTKVGFLTEAMFASQGVPASFHSQLSHRQCFSPGYIQWQVRRSADEVSVEAFLLHNPERQRHYLSKSDFEAMMLNAFEALEVQRQAGAIRSYGVAIWDVSADTEWNTAAYWAGMAMRSVGHIEGFRYFQHPVNLVDFRSIARIGLADSDIAFSTQNNITTIASSPLRGGELLTMIGQELADLIRPGTSVAEACYLASMSVPGLDWILAGSRRAKHIDELVQFHARGPVNESTLHRLSEVLA